MRITPEVLDAIREMMAKRGWTKAGLAHQLEISAPSISDWFTGATKSIRPAVWLKLEPHLRQYLGEEMKSDPTMIQVRQMERAQRPHIAELADFIAAMEQEKAARVQIESEKAALENAILADPDIPDSSKVKIILASRKQRGHDTDAD